MRKVALPLKLWILQRLFFWVAGWLDIAVGVINVATFTLYRPWWDFKFMAWSAVYIVQKNMKGRSNAKN